MVARGLPKEFVEIANRRMAAINDAFAMIERMDESLKALRSRLER